MRQPFNVEKFLQDADFSELSEDVAKNASLLAFYGAQEALWRTICDTVKMQVENKAAALEVAIKESGEKITDSTTKAKVQIDPEYQELKKKQIQALEQQRLYSNAISAIEQKGHMLVAHGNNLRGELSNQGMGVTSSIGRMLKVDSDRKAELVRKASGQEG